MSVKIVLIKYRNAVNIMDILVAVAFLSDILENLLQTKCWMIHNMTPFILFYLLFYLIIFLGGKEKKRKENNIVRTEGRRL